MDSWRRPFLLKACPKEIDGPPLGPYDQRLSSESALRTACFVAVLSMRKDSVFTPLVSDTLQGPTAANSVLKEMTIFHLVSSANLPVSTKGDSVIILSKMGNPLPN